MGSFFLDAGLVGIITYSLMCISDLENDYANPHDTAKRVNKVVVPEQVLHAIHLLYLIAGGRWGMVLLNTLPAIWAIYCRAGSKTPYLDVTEIFNQLPQEKKSRLLKLGFYMVVMVLVLYRLVQAAENVLLFRPKKLIG